MSVSPTGDAPGVMFRDVRAARVDGYRIAITPGLLDDWDGRLRFVVPCAIGHTQFCDDVTVEEIIKAAVG